MRKALIAAIVVLLAGAAIVYAVAVHAPPGPRSIRHFDPERTADLEVEMWKAYYDKSKVRLFGLLVRLLREQYRYTWSKAAVAGYHLATAASTFGDARSDCERVLPDLEKAYAIARDWTSSRFDPREVSRAELAWWIARRKKGENSPENVGRLIAEEYALLYEVPADRVARAALLRAQAGRLRDEGGKKADWEKVAGLLRESYADL